MARSMAAVYIFIVIGGNLYDQRQYALYCR